MKNPTHVAELISELRGLTETDFERHRLDVLERDLTSPPVVEVIDEPHQRFNGVTYHKSKDGHYNKNVSLHRIVWQYCCGDMPSPLEYDIHHKDWNHDNNCPSNLQKMTRGEHHAIHSRKYPAQEKICPHCGIKFIPKNRNKVYCSIFCYEAARKPQEKICPVCGKSFVPMQHSIECCSKSCAATLRCQNTAEVEKICPICGAKFVPKIKHTLYCSRACYKATQYETCTCVICGKEFLNKSHADVSTCSPNCTAKLRLQRRKSQDKMSD